MTVQSHEDFIHFAVCMERLNGAWRTLNAIKASGDNPLVGPAFRFALIEYATPYTRSTGPVKRRHTLSESYVPAEFLELHKRILVARNTIHAHADLTVMEAKLYVTETRGMPSATISSNYIHGLEELSNIDQIICLIEGTLLNMYANEDALLHALQP
jgi:hypothetical protein